MLRSGTDELRQILVRMQEGIAQMLKIGQTQDFLHLEAENEHMQEAVERSR